MKIAIIGLRSPHIEDFGKYLPKDVTEIVSGGAKGVDRCARNYAIDHKIRLAEFIPDYARFGKSAPLKRNLEIIAYANIILAFWDGKAAGQSA